MNEWTNERTNERTNEWINEWINEKIKFIASLFHTNKITRKTIIWLPTQIFLTTPWQTDLTAMTSQKSPQLNASALPERVERLTFNQQRGWLRSIKLDKGLESSSSTTTSNISEMLALPRKVRKSHSNPILTSCEISIFEHDDLSFVAHWFLPVYLHPRGL